jgi:hypothetical protein
MSTFLSILGFLGIPAGLYLSSLVIRGAQTGWAWAWLIAYVLLDLAALWASTEPRRARIAGTLGGLLLAGIFAGRLGTHHETPQARLITLPGETPVHWSAGLAEESDLAGMGFVAFTDFGAITHAEAVVARPALAAEYRRLRADSAYAPVATLAVPSLLNAASTASTPMLVLSPSDHGDSHGRAVVVLHGLGGGLTLSCWMLARTMPDAVIVCPTIGLGAEWGSETGYRAYTSAVEYAQAHASAVYVLGMSSGATGLEGFLSRNQLGHIAGAVMLSGYEEAGFDAVRRSEIPLLIIRGDHDPRTPPFDLHGVASLDHIQILEAPGGHYVYLEQPDTVLTAIDTFCAPR